MVFWPVLEMIFSFQLSYCETFLHLLWGLAIWVRGRMGVSLLSSFTESIQNRALKIWKFYVLYEDIKVSWKVRNRVNNSFYPLGRLVPGFATAFLGVPRGARHPPGPVSSGIKGCCGEAALGSLSAMVIVTGWTVPLQKILCWSPNP